MTREQKILDLRNRFCAWGRKDMLDANGMLSEAIDFGYNEAVENVCKWLEENLDRFVFEGREGKPYISVALEGELRKAMKGEVDHDT